MVSREAATFTSVPLRKELEPDAEVVDDIAVAQVVAGVPPGPDHQREVGEGVGVNSLAEQLDGSAEMSVMSFNCRSHQAAEGAHVHVQGEQERPA